MIRGDGTGLRRLTNDAAREGLAGWTPESREVVFTQTAPGPMSMTPVPTKVLAVTMDGTTRELGTILGRGATISPDGKRLAWSGGRPQASFMAVSNVDGSNPRNLTDSARVAAFNFAWAPDGQRIAYTQMTIGPERVLSIWSVHPDGSDARKLADIPAGEGSAQWPSWSPDGKRVAVQVGKYDRTDPTKNTAHVWVIDVATTIATKLAPHDRPYLDETPSWVDNRRIAIQSDRSGRMEIWIVSTDGKEAVQLTK